ncbi:AAA family ATPase [Facklamia sp. P12955]|uniref:AAA family ATPase n=1 Tax=Facklamia sp. P12955 TaxID=3421946 RepID=UPI003D16A7C2
MGEKLFRKQLSMYQNKSFADYVFGGNHAEASLARDLLERESKILLFDEFDKANSIFYSAFYQMFDEGRYEDKNYSFDMQNSIIICTSNFLNL